MRFFALLGIVLFAPQFWGVAEADNLGDELPSLYVTAGTGLNLRSGPGTQFDVITAVPCGRVVFQIERVEGWVNISLHNTDRDSTAWVSEKFLSTAKQNCPKMYSCHDCGHKTENSPGVFGYSMCNSCMKSVNAEALRKLKQIESGKNFKCEFCGSYAARGKGMCNSCIKEAGKLLGGG